MAQERLRHFSLPPPLPTTREQTKALLQSALAYKRSQRLQLVTLMPPATEQPTKRKRDGQAAKNRQPLQEKQDASGSAPIASQCTNNDYLAKCQQQARHTYTLPPCVSSDGLSEKQIARGDFYLRPNDRYTKRQQDLLDMDEDDGSEADWKYSKDETIS